MVQLVFLYPLGDQLTSFGQVSMLAMIKHLFTSYGTIDKIYLKENAVKTMWPYDSAEPLARLIHQLEKGGEFLHTGGQKISDTMMVSKGITLLAQTDTFNKDIIDWI